MKTTTNLEKKIKKTVKQHSSKNNITNDFEGVITLFNGLVDKGLTKKSENNSLSINNSYVDKASFHS